MRRVKSHDRNSYALEKCCYECWDSALWGWVGAMRNCKRYRQWMNDRLLGDLPEDRGKRLDEHLAVCPECRRFWEDLSSFARRMQKVRLEVASPDWDTLWTGIEERCRQTRTKRQPAAHRWGETAAVRWGLRTAAALLLVVFGALIGRFLFAPGEQPHGVPASGHGGEAIQQALERMERGTVLLLGLINLDASDKELQEIDFTGERVLSEKLLEGLPELSLRLRELNREDLARLLDDLDFVLLQIANSEDLHSRMELQLIRDSVESRALLLRMNLEMLKENRTQTARKSSPKRAA